MQKLIVKDSESKKRLPNVKVQVDASDIGHTNEKGMITFPVEQKNQSDGYLLTLTVDGYVPVKIKIKNAVNGGYLVGDIALFLLGIVPGVVGLVVDAVTGEWYSYKDNLIIEMHAK